MTDKVLYLEEISAPLSVVPAGTRIEMSRPKEAIDIGHKPMTDTAKPTAEQSNELLERANIIDEYQSVYNCTGLAPRQLLDRLNHLQHGYSKTQHEIKQVLGKALGNYPWYKDDQKNFPSATDADGVCVGEHVAETIAEEAADVIVHLKEQRDELIGLLREFVAVTGENCRHDHHGYCQEHFLEEDCLVARTINTLAKCGKEKTND